MKTRGIIILVLACWVICHPVAGIGAVSEESNQDTYEIKGYSLSGSTILLLEERVLGILQPFTGTGKTPDDIEEARKALEHFYHDAGYVTAQVFIPVPQTLEDGVVDLQVRESRIRRVRVTGNRYSTQERILKELPSIRRGKGIFLPQIKKEFNRLNLKPDMKVVPSMVPGRKENTVDLELEVKDESPFHAGVEINNESSPDTTETRLNVSAGYSNLWQRNHALNLMCQVSPEDPDESRTIAGSYLMPAPWQNDHQLIFFGLRSNTDAAATSDFQVTGKGKSAGITYIIPLKPVESYYSHSISLGLTYKNFLETMKWMEEAELVIEEIPIEYMPFSIEYAGTIRDRMGISNISAALTMSFRGLGSGHEEFEQSRFRGKGNFIYANLGFERIQDMFWGMKFYNKLDFQATTNPLVSNEQFTAGGSDNVRGYGLSEASGDSGARGNFELILPELGNIMGTAKYFRATPYMFYDVAELWVKDALDWEKARHNLEGTGVGLRGSVMEHMTYEINWAYALHDTDHTDRGDKRFHFKMKFAL